MSQDHMLTSRQALTCQRLKIELNDPAFYSEIYRAWSFNLQDLAEYQRLREDTSRPNLWGDPADYAQAYGECFARDARIAHLESKGIRNTLSSFQERYGRIPAQSLGAIHQDLEEIYRAGFSWNINGHLRKLEELIGEKPQLDTGNTDFKTYAINSVKKMKELDARSPEAKLLSNHICIIHKNHPGLHLRNEEEVNAVLVSPIKAFTEEQVSAMTAELDKQKVPSAGVRKRIRESDSERSSGSTSGGGIFRSEEESPLKKQDTSSEKKGPGL